ncbi:hypothetical protein DFH09DRAFT_1405431 [Mycena vulgaris]|nr:hypothetical protein DFH09DRAFT_1405431 [Mycena vulgaris]
MFEPRWLACIAALAGIACVARAADCTTATVSSPFSTCFDIYTNAGLTAAQFAADNPGLDCSLIQPGQKVCVSSGTLPSNAPSASPNGTCFEYHVIPNDSCSGIALKFDITVAEIEQWNAQTYKWTGCPALQIGFTMCVSSGTPPPIPINPDLELRSGSVDSRTIFAIPQQSPNPCISNCFIPTLPSCGTGSVKRNLAYYAGWADRRPCDISVPGDTDWGGYTHAHFAFAVISQNSEIQLATADVPLLQALVAEKAVNPGLKVLIAVGGWDFSEADPTRDLFSVTIGSAQARSAFIASVKTFLATYQLDGIDIDFEYPGAIERGAPATDTPNLTTFFQELRSALGSSVLISCATPAGYWFLKGFEIDKIAAEVDYINMMSYDYHGQWDTNVTDQAPVTNPHTSIEDMTTSVLLYTRAGIDMSKVNLGLAWYGRTYHLSDASCKGYNCTMVGGGAAGACSGASGYLTQFEITDILAGGITPTLDRASDTYWFDNAGDLVTFDQADTWAKKQVFAASTCFGGTFVWSVDEVLADGDSGSGGEGGGGFDSFSLIPWNPNPHPTPGAQSETFVGGGSSVVIPTPTLITFITVGGGIITLSPGGTPVNALLPSTVSELNAVTPTWTFNIVPPASVQSITFTAPILGVETFSTVIPSPSSGVVTITGPAGGVWTLTAGPSGASILGTLPTSIGISGGMTPTATPPVGWLGPWTDPVLPHSVTTMQPVQSNTHFTWNPNPFPPPGATSETFICSGTTTSIPIPTATTTISAGGATIVLNSGGTPVNEPLASQCTEVAGILPTWSQDIIPPPGASIITFTGPLTSTPTWVTTVPVPLKSDSSDATVVGPLGDKNRCNDLDLWSLLFGGIIHPCLPLDVGIIGGITPVPVPPPGWTGPWTDPIPRPTPQPGGPGNSETQTSTSTSSSSSSDAACPTKPASLDLPDDADNSNWDDDGTDPDQRRRRSEVQVIPRDDVAVNLPSSQRSTRGAHPFNTTYDVRAVNSTHSALFRRANRHIKIKRCTGSQAESPTAVTLGAGNYITLDPRRANWETILISQSVGSKPTVAGETNQEHVFELGYISQFVGAAPMTNGDCSWVQDNLFDYVRADGSTMGLALVKAIDTVANMVWVDKPLNQAKSNVVNQNSDAATNPPQLATMSFLRDVGEFNSDGPQIYATEDFLRHLAALGQYFGGTAPIFQATALRIQNLLSEITPSSVIVGDASLPLVFYSWLGNLLNSYPNGCTSRGQNAWNYYRGAMAAISLREARPAPVCFELYAHNQYTPSTFAPQNLMPPAPQSPQCNVPGVVGTLVYAPIVPSGALAPVEVFPYGGTSGAVRIMGSGNTNFYAVGSGPSISGRHVQGRALDGSQYPGCGGSYLFDDVPPGTAGYSTANIAFTCNGLTQQQEVAIDYVMNGQPDEHCAGRLHDVLPISRRIRASRDA